MIGPARRHDRTDGPPARGMKVAAQPMMEMSMSSTDLARSVLTGMLHCAIGSLAAGLVSAAFLIAVVRLLA